MKQIKIAYIGGGSKAWARVFMTDLALADDLSGEIAVFTCRYVHFTVYKFCVG